MKLERSVARKIMASAISSAVAGRPAGACAASCSTPSPIASVPSVRVGAGLTALTRTPRGPYSVPHDLVDYGYAVTSHSSFFETSATSKGGIVVIGNRGQHDEQAGRSRSGHAESTSP